MLQSERALLQALPKADLHIHLDGSVRPETLLALAEQYAKLDEEAKRDLPSLPASIRTVRELLPYMQAADDCRSLPEYLSKFEFVLEWMQHAPALERISYELVEQAAAENCIYMEVRFAPQLHTNRGLTLDEVLESVAAGLQRGEADFGVVTRIIVICMRHHDFAANSAAIEAAARFCGRGVAAVDLAGDESGFPAAQFRSLFALAGQYQLPVTIHAGEAAGAGNIAAAVQQLGAQRIGHGVRLREDSAVFELVRGRRIPLEMCPVSNLQTKAVQNWNDYPALEYLQQGLPVTINTDNRTVSGTTLTKEYECLMERAGWKLEHVLASIRFAVQAAFVPPELKEQLQMKLQERLLQLGIE